MTEDCKAIIDFLGCEYELFEKEKSAEKIIGRLDELAEQGKRDGFFPLLIHPDGVLCEMLDIGLDEDAGLENTPENIAAFRENILREAEGIDAREFLAERLGEYMETYGDDILGDFSQYEPCDRFCSYMDMSRKNRPHTELIIAKIPAKNPWELAAWLPMGGWNDCPSPAQQAAVFRYWFEKYGAVPGAVTHDEWELKLSRPPTTDEDAEVLAKERFAFCEDIVSQGLDTIRALASASKGSSIWYFWWD